jgi:hypothetical protein
MAREKRKKGKRLNAQRSMKGPGVTLKNEAQSCDVRVDWAEVRNPATDVLHTRSGQSLEPAYSNSLIGQGSLRWPIR